MPMKSINIIALLAIFSTALIYQNTTVAAFTPSDEELELVETMMNLKISQCYMQTDELKLEDCSTKIMNYVNILCSQYGDLKSGKCDRAEQYMRDRS